MEEEKKEIKKSNKMVFIIFGIVILLLVGAIIFLALKLNNNQTTNTSSSEDIDNTEKIEVASDNITLGLSTTSFSNMQSDDESFTDAQQEILKYFDNDYFEYFMIRDLQKYPQIFRGAKITTNATIVKVLKSTDEEYEVLAIQGGDLLSNENYGYSDLPIEELSQDSLMIIKGKQLNKRMVQGDVITLYGRYNNVESFDIDGVNYILPTFTTMNLVQSSNDIEKNYTFDLDTIKTVAEAIFGKDIKISKPVIGEDYEYEGDYTLQPYYKVTLDNQSNANFNVFNMYRDYGTIRYNNVPQGTVKQLYVSADFQHYIVITYDENLKHIYIDYFDKDLKKLWNREFDYHSNDVNNMSIINGIGSDPIDYTSTQMAIVIDNDLYLIDLATGQNVFDPIMVGAKTELVMMADGILLVGNDNKDTIMKIDYSGNIIFRTNGGTDFVTVNGAEIQIIDNKMLIRLFGFPEDDIENIIFIVLNNDGTIESSTEPLGGIV